MRRRIFPALTYNSYVAKSALFTGGSGAHATRSGTFTGAADAGTFTVSLWYDPTANNGTLISIFRTTSNGVVRFEVRKTTGDVIQIIGYNASATQILNQIGTTTVNASTGYAHIFARCDLSAPDFSMRINGVAETLAGGGTLTASELFDFAATSPGQSIGNGGVKMSAHLAELWFDDTDLGDSAHSLFGAGSPRKPISLGANGGTPKGGVAPVLYLSMNGDGTSWLTDSSGNGNNFTGASGTINNGTPP